jgi:hypothetical protein
MDRNPRNAIRVGVAVIVMMGLFPPWTQHLRYGNDSIGYSPIFYPPSQGTLVGIDISRLLVQWFLVFVVLAAYMYLSRSIGSCPYCGHKIPAKDSFGDGISQ